MDYHGLLGSTKSILMKQDKITGYVYIYAHMFSEVIAFVLRMCFALCRIYKIIRKLASNSSRSSVGQSVGLMSRRSRVRAPPEALFLNFFFSETVDLLDISMFLF